MTAPLLTQDNNIEDVANRPAILDPAGNRLSLEERIILNYAVLEEEMKTKVDNHAAESYRNQDVMKLVSSIIAEINSITDSKNNVDLTKHAELQRKMQAVQDLGASVDAKKMKYDTLERDRLIENLNLKADECNQEVKKHNQKMEVMLKTHDRVTSTTDYILKALKNIYRAIIQNLKS